MLTISETNFLKLYMRKNMVGFSKKVKGSSLQKAIQSLAVGGFQDQLLESYSTRYEVNSLQRLFQV